MIGLVEGAGNLPSSDGTGEAARGVDPAPIDHCGGEGFVEGDGSGKPGRENVRGLTDLLSKLNPMAEEFVPGMLSSPNGIDSSNGVVAVNNEDGNGAGLDRSGAMRTEWKNDPGARKRRKNYRPRLSSLAQKDDMIKRTVYVSDIDYEVTEEELANFFSEYGPVNDCRICGDPNSVLHFAFVEFAEEEDAKAALGFAGTLLGSYEVRVLRSKTAIAPVDRRFLPKNDDDQERCRRTIYCSNVDKMVSVDVMKTFFGSVCGEVHCLRMLGDYRHATRIAFIEFVDADCAAAALHCSGWVLGSLPIRVSPSKTPVRQASSDVLAS